MTQQERFREPKGTGHDWFVRVGDRVYVALRRGGWRERLYFRLAERARTADERLTAQAWLFHQLFPWRISFLILGNPVKQMLAMPESQRVSLEREIVAWLRGGDVPRFSLVEG